MEFFQVPYCSPETGILSVLMVSRRPSSVTAAALMSLLMLLTSASIQVSQNCALIENL